MIHLPGLCIWYAQRNQCLRLVVLESGPVLVKEHGARPVYSFSNAVSVQLYKAVWVLKIQAFRCRWIETRFESGEFERE
jgi:hypothetical protein